MSRGGKSKNAYLPGDLVALGSKNSRVEPNPQEKRGGNILLHRKLMESTLSGKLLVLTFLSYLQLLEIINSSAIFILPFNFYAIYI